MTSSESRNVEDKHAAPFGQEALAKIAELQAIELTRRIIVVTPGASSAERIQAEVCQAGLLGVSVVESKGLVPRLLPPGHEYGPRVRTLGFWSGFVAERYPNVTSSRREQRALELFNADLSPNPSDDDAAEISTVAERTIRLVEAIAERTCSVIAFGFEDEDSEVDLPTPLDAILAALEEMGFSVGMARSSIGAGDPQQRRLFELPDRMSEVVAVVEAVSTDPSTDLAIVVPDDGFYQEALSALLNRKGLQVRTAHPRELGDLPVGRWLRNFHLAATDSFARPLMIDLMTQLATAGILDVEMVVDLDRQSREAWVIDSRHWRKLAGLPQLPTEIRKALNLVLDAAAALSGTDATSLEKLLDFVAPLDPERHLRSIRLDTPSRTNRSRLLRGLRGAVEQSGSGVKVVRLSDAFGLIESTVYVLGMDTTATYRNSQTASEIDAFKAKRHSWRRLLSTTPNLFVTAPTSDLATGERLERSAWTNSVGEPRWLGPASAIRMRQFEDSATECQRNWIVDGPSRQLDFPVEEHRWSPSQLDTFQRCPTQWMLRYRFRLRRWSLPEVDEVLDAATRGNVVHRVLEQQERLGGVSFEDLIHEAIAENLTQNALIDGDPLVEVVLADLAQRIRVGHQEIERKLQVPNDSIEAHERKIPETEVDCGGVSVRLTGKIDRLTDATGERRVLDYKSGKEATSEGDLASAGASGEHLQLWVYGLVLEALGEGFPTDLTLAFPLAQLRGKQTRVSSVRATPRQFEKVATGVGRVVAAAAGSRLPFAQQGFTSPCRYCEVAQACPTRHRRAPFHNPRALFGGSR